MRTLSDVKFALRQMVQRPGFTLAVVLTLAIARVNPVDALRDE